jgi:hypothetical protein
MEITYKFNKQDKVGVCFLFEPNIRGVVVTDYGDWVHITHADDRLIRITVGKHLAKPHERATMDWCASKQGGQIEYVDRFHHCLETAILIASLINSHYKKGN